MIYRINAILSKIPKIFIIEPEKIFSSQESTKSSQRAKATFNWKNERVNESELKDRELWQHGKKRGMDTLFLDLIAEKDRGL